MGRSEVGGTKIISEYLRNQLLIIAGKVPDGDEGSIEPMVAQFGFPRVSGEDAGEILAYEHLVEWVATMLNDHGEEKTVRLLRIYAKLLKTPSAVETLQLVERTNHASSNSTTS